MHRRPVREHLVFAMACLLMVFSAEVAHAQEAPTSRPDGVDRERRENEAFLARPDVVRAIDGFPDSTWIAVFGGEMIETAKDLAALLEKIEKPSRNTAHRFIFQKSMRGDERATTTLGYEQTIGNTFPFTQPFAIGSKDGKTLIALGDHKYVSFPAEPNLAASGGRPLIPVEIAAPGGKSVKMRFLYATGFSGRMILAPGVEFPRAEVPGRGLVHDFAEIDGKDPNAPPTRIFRRYLVRSVVKDMGTDAVHVAFGGEIIEKANDDVNFLGTTWARMNGKSRALIAERRKPVLVLGDDPRDADLVMDAGPLTAAELKQWTTILARKSVEGALGGTGSVMDLYTNETAAVTIFAMGISFAEGEAMPWLFGTGHAVRIGKKTADADLAKALAQIRALLD